MFVSKYVTSETNAWKYYNFDKSRYTNPKYIICNFILKKKKKLKIQICLLLLIINLKMSKFCIWIYFNLLFYNLSVHIYSI